MKKAIKKGIALVLLSCLLCGLCGCTAIDEMRENQAFIDATGRIQWQGNTYVPLTRGELPGEEDPDRIIYVTDPDVPVLLSQTVMKTICFVTKDGKFLMDIEGNLYCQANVDTDAWQEGEQTT